MKKSMKTKNVSMKIASLVLVLVIMVGAFSMAPTKVVKAAAHPVGVDPVLPLGKIISIDTDPDGWWCQSHYYTINVPETGYISVNCIENINGFEIVDANNFQVWGAKNSAIFIRGGQYSFRIDVLRGGVGKFAVTFVSAKETYKESETSNNDSESTPSKITSLSGAVNKGVLSQNDTDDWYSFNVSNNSVINFNVKSLTSKDLNYALMRTDGTSVVAQARWDEKEFKNTFVLTPGSYLLLITGDASQNYNFSIKATPLNTSASSLIGKAPVVKAKKKGKLTVKWNKYAMAGGYQIQVSKKKNFAGATTKNVEATSNNLNMTVKKAWRGKKVFVRVRAYVITPDEQKLYTGWSKVKAVKTKKK